MSWCEKGDMEGLPEELQAHIHELRPVPPCAKMMAALLKRIGYNDDEGMLYCPEDYRQEPDYLDSRYDRKRGCVSSFYGWGEEWDDERLHGGRGPWAAGALRSSCLRRQQRCCCC